ncbi:FG-GAP repeat domain-containing protein [Taibaiella koreensis]|uniref:FG-GAP repeat domain-containing protein n=1 Tax=Taibaiella koreensis TaxID=1268548 RepID=UPI0013C2F320|nr:VCBS repeat-containing protein [Taibaiella koreensis]
MKTKLLLAGTLLPLSLFAQTLCNIDPAKIGDGLTVSGSFSSSNKLTNSLAFFQEVEIPPFFDKEARIINYENSYDYGPAHFPDTLKVVWKSSPNFYNLDKIRNRVVSGDFDHDGSKDDIAALYDNGNGTTSIHLWFCNDATGAMSFHNVWTAAGYTAGMTTGKVVSGDFDNDGYQDDIAVFYDYGGGNTGIHVWKIDGTAAPTVSSWWSSSSFTAGQINYRVVSGDFDRDNYIDDIAAMYDHGGGSVSIFVFQGNGSSFSGSTWWQNTSGYTPAQIDKRMVAGNFDESKKNGRKHKNDDIAAFYDYGGGVTKIHFFKSNGSSFSLHEAWNGPSFTASNITGRVAAMEVQHPPIATNNDNSDRCSSIGGLYNYGTTTDKMCLWTADQLNNNTYINSSYNFFCDQQKGPRPDEGNATGIAAENTNTFSLFPNPGRETFCIRMGKGNQRTIVKLLGIDGREYYPEQTTIGNLITINTRELVKGIYFVQVYQDDMMTGTYKWVRE